MDMSIIKIKPDVEGACRSKSFSSEHHGRVLVVNGMKEEPGSPGEVGEASDGAENEDASSEQPTARDGKENADEGDPVIQGDHFHVKESLQAMSKRETSVNGFAEEPKRTYDHFLLWLTKTNKYLGTICENHLWLSTVNRVTLRNLRKGDHVLLKGNLVARVLFRGKISDCRRNEVFVECYLEEYQHSKICLDTLLNHLDGQSDNSDFESVEQAIADSAPTTTCETPNPRSTIPFSSSVLSSSPRALPSVSSESTLEMKREKRPAQELHTAAKRARMADSEAPTVLCRASTNESSSIDCDLEQPTIVDVSGGPRNITGTANEEDTNRLLRILVRQNKELVRQNREVVNLLRTMAEVHHSSVWSQDETRYVDKNGAEFLASDLPKSSPNVFAINFLKRVLGEEFKNTIVDPHGPSDQVPLDGSRLQLLKDALSKNFTFYVFNKVRHSVNQAARDVRRRCDNL